MEIFTSTETILAHWKLDLNTSGVWLVYTLISYTQHKSTGGKVPKSTTSTSKDSITIVYFILNAENKLYVNPARRYVLQPLL